MATELPPSLADALRPTLPQLTDDIIATIGREVPDYRRPMEGDFGRAVAFGTRRALRRFVDAIADPTVAQGALPPIYDTLGRGELRAGRSLAALLSAYRVGARLAWERFSAAGAAAGHEPAVLYRLASEIFVYIDAISALSVDGYADEQAQSIGERERNRRALLRLLARDDVALEEVADLAALAGWPLPQTVAAIVAPAAVEGALARVGPDVLVVTDEGVAYAFVGDPDAPGRRASLEAAVAGHAAALGPSVPTIRSAHSLARARSTSALIGSGRLPGAGLVPADGHLLDLLLHAGDGRLATELADAALAPLADLGETAREKLVATLGAWLDHPGQVQRVAAELDIHPQTVRYRVGQLRERFGARLDDPEERFRLAVALRTRRA